VRDAFTLGAEVREAGSKVGRLKAIGIDMGSRRLHHLVVSSRDRLVFRIPAAVFVADGEVVILQEGWRGVLLGAPDPHQTIELSAHTRVYGLDGQRLGQILAAYFDHDTQKGTLGLRPLLSRAERRLIRFDRIVDFNDGDVNTDIPTWQWPLFREMPDEEVRDRVVEALRSSTELGKLDAGAIQVVVSEQSVLLKGHARNRHKAALAVFIASSTMGVPSVKHEFIYDEDLEKAINQALAADPLAAIASVQVGVTLGVVSLIGVGPSRDASEAAEAAALRVPGVLTVRNFIVVGATPAPVV
jgi:hypothetical protein